MLLVSRAKPLLTDGQLFITVDSCIYDLSDIHLSPQRAHFSLNIYTQCRQL